MTPAETAHLVDKIVQTWPTGPKGRIWTEVLGPLEARPADAAYRQLRDTETRPPTVGRFLEEYRHLTRPRAGIAIPEWTGPPVALAEVIDHRAELEPLRRLRAGEYGARRRHPSSSGDLEPAGQATLELAPDLDDQPELEP